MSTNNNPKIDVYSFDTVWKRVCKTTVIKKQNDLAEVVGVKQNTVSARKKQDIWPEEWAYRIGKRHNLLTEWILTGEGPKNLDESRKDQKLDILILKEIEQWLKELVLNDSERMDWFIMSFQDAFPMFKAWIKRKEEEIQKDNISHNSKVA